MMLIAAIPDSWKACNSHASHQIVEDNLTRVKNLRFLLPLLPVIYATGAKTLFPLNISG